MNYKYVFVGNRSYVYNKMLELECDVVAIFAVKNSYLEKELIRTGRKYFVLTDKEDLVEKLETLDFDILISNGCPFILPISIMKKRKYINIHPSLLPDLRGKHPINGAVLFERKHGVTCHYMDDSIDLGPVISQRSISLKKEYNLDLIYQISFRMEALVFEDAMKKDFSVNTDAKNDCDSIYYSRKQGDNILMASDDLASLKRKVRAFSSVGKYSIIYINQRAHEVQDICEIPSDDIEILLKEYTDRTVLWVYGERFILSSIDGCLVQMTLKNVIGISEDSKLFS